VPPDDDRSIDDDLSASPDRATLFRRAAAKHCPVCDQGHLFHRWFRLAERCPHCGLRFVREEGHRTGDFGLNIVVTFGALLLTLIVATLITWPDLPAGPTLITATLVVILVPVAFYPWSRLLWLAFDLSVNPLRDGEVSPTR
jgi:uncharacterized protein (DUF983 family)